MKIQQTRYEQLTALELVADPDPLEPAAAPIPT